MQNKLSLSVGKGLLFSHAKKIIAGWIATGTLAAILLTGSAAMLAPSFAQAATGCIPTLSLTPAANSIIAGGTITLTMTYQNKGQTSCNNASISTYYDAGESFVSATPKPTAATKYYWQLGNIAPGEQTSVAVIVAVSTADASLPSIHTEACGTADNGNDSCPDSYVTVSVPAATPAVPAPAPTPARTQPELPTTAEYGTWVWQSPAAMTPSYETTIFSEAAAEKFNAMYVTIDDYLTTSPTQLAAYENKLESFLEEAAAKGIAVDAEAGSSNWSEPGNQWQAASITSFVASFNAAHAIKFRGVQFDIEPYTLPQYTTDPGGILTDYANFVESLVNQDKNLGLPLGFDIPHFYDDIIAWTPEITIDGITAYPYEQILRILNEIPNGRFLIMAYRNTAEGSNGTVALAQTEIQEAAATRVKIFVGQEMGNYPPSYITFFGETKAAVATQAALIDQAFAPYASFGGISIEDIDTYNQLP